MEELINARPGNVTIKGSVVLRIVQHITETPVALRNLCGGALLGVPTADSVLVTNCFPYVEDTVSPNTSYKHMKEMYGEMFPVGWYMNCQHYTGFAELIGKSIFRHQIDYEGSILLLYDHNKTCNGGLHFRAFRLTSAALSLIEMGRFSSECINQCDATLDNYFEELFVSYTNSPLTNLLLTELEMCGYLDSATRNSNHLKCQPIESFHQSFDVIAQSFDTINGTLQKNNAVAEDKCRYIEKITNSKKPQSIEQEVAQTISTLGNLDKKNCFNAMYTANFYSGRLDADLQCIYQKLSSVRALIGEFKKKDTPTTS